MQVFVGRSAQGFESEVINDEQRHAHQRGELAVVHAGRAGGVQALREGRAAGEDDVHALAHRAVAQGLGEVALADAAGPDQQHRGLLVQVAPGGQVMHQRPVEIGQTPEVELLKRLGGSELRAAQPHVELLALAPGDLVADEHGQEIGVGELGADGLTVALVQRIEDARQAQQLELGGEFGDGVGRVGVQGF